MEPGNKFENIFWEDGNDFFLSCFVTYLNNANLKNCNYTSLKFFCKQQTPRNWNFNFFILFEGPRKHVVNQKCKNNNTKFYIKVQINQDVQYSPCSFIIAFKSFYNKIIKILLLFYFFYYCLFFLIKKLLKNIK